MRIPRARKFRLDTPDELADSTAHIRPGNVLIAVRNPHQLDHLKSVLETTDTRRIDIVVVSVKFTGQPGFGEHDLTAEEVFSTDIAKLFSLVVSLAEKAGKHVELMVVPGRDRTSRSLKPRNGCARPWWSWAAQERSPRWSRPSCSATPGSRFRSRAAALVAPVRCGNRGLDLLQPGSASPPALARGYRLAPPALVGTQPARAGVQAASSRCRSRGVAPPGCRASLPGGEFGAWGPVAGVKATPRIALPSRRKYRAGGKQPQTPTSNGVPGLRSEEARVSRLPDQPQALALGIVADPALVVE